MSIGYVKVFRSTLENPLVMKDSEHFQIWIVLLLLATHKDVEIMYCGKRKLLKRGQFVTSRDKLARITNINSSKVERILKVLEIEQQIEQLKTFKSRIITIKNYEDYQGSEQLSEQLVNSYRTASEQLVNTNKNVKNVKNVKNTTTATSAHAREDAFDYLSFGKLGNVKLLEKEHEKLKAKYPQKYERAIMFLDHYIESKGSYDKDHYRAIYGWVFKAVEEQDAKLNNQPKSKAKGKPSSSAFQSKAKPTPDWFDDYYKKFKEREE
jgi:DNA replication protein DnaD